jgi:hypothetical protein
VCNAGRVCVETFESVNVSYPPPTNWVVFEIVELAEKYIRQKCWELGITKENEQGTDGVVSLKIEEQCLYTFCQRKKFDRDGVMSLFCSQECKKNHGELESIT